MLAVPSRHQHISTFAPHHIPTSSPSSSQLASSHRLPHRRHPHAQPLDIDTAHLANPPVDPASTTPTSLCDPAQYMSESFYLQQPAIRIQQSAPVPQLTTNGWTNFSDEGNGQLAASPSLQTTGYPRRTTHQRATSSSSITSSPSSYGYSTPAFSVGHPEGSPSLSADKFESYPAAESRSFSNTLPTPTHTPIQDSFASRSFSNFTSQPNLEPAMAANMALKHDLLDTPEHDLPEFGHSERHSVSSFGNSPSTPHTAQDDFDHDFKLSANGERTCTKVESWIDAYLHFDDEPDPMRHSVPMFDRAMTSAYKDDVINPSSGHLASPQARIRSQHGFLSPYSKNQQLAELLHEANKNRAQSPSGLARPVSPFRQSSPYAFQASAFDATQGRLRNPTQMRPRHKMEADALGAQPDDSQAPKTISPKDVQLEYHESEEDAKMPLFPDEGEYNQTQYVGGNQYGNATPNGYDSASAANFGNVDAGRSQSWMSSPQSAPAPPQSSFTFAPPAGAGVHGLQFTSAPQYRSVSGLTGTEPTPEFPAHLTSMESSASEAGFDNLSTGPTSTVGDIKRPDSTFADGGTYSCTYHGCTHRFDSPQKLQRHKRDGHRHSQPTSHPDGARSTSPLVGSNMSSAALLARNSQAGPHRCDRINPTTGKPCSTIFSRPYDLTRHEDTIHNARKQKVRCALCVEEKTFSRNDALTRHMRVVHPEVDFPGKHRRRGA